VALPIEPDGGGTVGAVSFRVTSQEPTIKVLAGGRVVDAMTIGVHENKYGLDFAFTITRAEWQGEGTKVAAYDYTSYIQEIAGADHVVGIQYAQDVNPANGLLTDVLYVTVATTALDQTAVVTIPFQALNTPHAFQLIADTYNALQRNGALTGS
jgi:hypothetical protein